MRVHVLLDGSMLNAGDAAAIAVLELALRGYLTIKPGDAHYRSAVIARTEQPADGLELDQQMLLTALLGPRAEQGTTASLLGLYQLPVAQTIMAATRAQLVRDGMIYACRPRAVCRWTRGIFAAAAISAMVTATAITRALSGFFLSLLAVIALWAILDGFFITWLQGRHVFRTERGRAETQPFRELRNFLRRGEPPCEPAADTLLLYALLWVVDDKQRRENLARQSLAACEVPPAWWRGSHWASTPERLPDVVQAMANVLGQSPRSSGSRYKVAGPEHFSGADLAGGRPGGPGFLDDLFRDLQSSGLSDWGGGGGHSHAGEGGGGEGGGGH
jgi:uncharacterized membrane protein YgcG